MTGQDETPLPGCALLPRPTGPAFLGLVLCYSVLLHSVLLGSFLFQVKIVASLVTGCDCTRMGGFGSVWAAWGLPGDMPRKAPSCQNSYQRHLLAGADSS